MKRGVYEIRVDDNDTDIAHIICSILESKLKKNVGGEIVRFEED